MENSQMFIQMKEYNTLKGKIIFEIFSWVGRKFFKNRSKIPLTPEPVLLDLGVGENYTDNWIHTDFFRFRNPIKVFLNSKSRKLRAPEVQLDLRYPLYCPDDSIDGVFTSHTIEHLFPNEAIKLLSEIYRVLKPNNWLRIIVPDLKIAVEFYSGKNQKFNYKTGCEAIMHVTQNSGHRSAWDEEFLSQVLKNVGFINIKKVDYGIGGQDKRLIKEREIRKFESLVIEAQKPDIFKQSMV